jgi:nitroimidazol reductase NimA-like FMN-containing flavoprotein (pyridoxamine 5'-phosphate oxidase superfamily)
LHNDKIYFHCAKEGQKLDNIKLSPAVCFSAVNFSEPVYNNGDYSTYFESAVVFGRASIVENSDERKEGLFKLTEKYFPDKMNGFENSYSATTDRLEVVAISIERITGKAKKKL